MNNNSYRVKIEGISELECPFPISHSLKNHSSGLSSSMNLVPPKNRQYRSPNSTPTTSPVPLKMLSCDELSQCFTKKESTTKDHTYYLKQKIQIQEKRIQLLEEENKRLVLLKNPENWEKELIKRNDDMRKLENKLRYYKNLASERNESDRLQNTAIEKDNKIANLEAELNDCKRKIIEYEKRIEELNKENTKIIQIKGNHENCLKKEECEILLNQIQDLEKALEMQALESKNLKEENYKLKTDAGPGSLLYFSQDINKIRREMNKLARILEDFIAGKEITLKILLGMDSEWKGEPIKQVFNDVQYIKGDLSKILAIISDIHAEHCGNIVCKNQ